MRITTYTFLSLSLLILINCKRTAYQIKSTMILYSDSTYTKKIDSLVITQKGKTISDTDTLFSHKKFPLTGFFKIINPSGSYRIGKLKQGNRIGKWKYYDNGIDTLILLEESNYNPKGELHGRYITYDYLTKNIEQLFYFQNGQMMGEQKTFYPNGNLFTSYFQDGEGNYIGKYLVYKENKDTLYYQDFGTTGTGYLKRYNMNENKLERESMIINKKWEGLSTEYVWGFENADTDSSTSLRMLIKTIYLNNLPIAETTIYNTPSTKKITPRMYADSSLTFYTNQGVPIKTGFYYQGKLIKTENHKN